MSLAFEYRRWAAVCLDLAKRATVAADKTRLLLLAEAWLDFADRVTRKDGDEKRRNGDAAERPLVTSRVAPVTRYVGGATEGSPRKR